MENCCYIALPLWRKTLPLYCIKPVETTIMNRFMLSFLMLWAALFVKAAEPLHDLDSIYHCLDMEIERYATYVAKKEAGINLLKRQLKNAQEPELKYAFCFQLYEEYRAFENHTAMNYLRACVRLAHQLGDPVRADRCHILLSICCSKTGLYDEAEKYLALVDVKQLSPKNLGDYYHACYKRNSELAYYTSVTDLKADYQQKADEYEQLMQRFIPRNCDLSYQIRELRLLNSKQLEASMKLNTEWLRIVKKGSHRYALVALYRYLEYKAVNDTTRMMYWLAESALADVRNGIMDQGSLWEMANQLMLQGDVDRSYRYISFTSDCANRFGSRQRSWQISPLLAVIAKRYKMENEHKTELIQIAALSCGVLALLLLASVIFVNRQRKRLALASKKQKHYNRQLSQINAQLSELNRQLSSSNMKLGESNRVKEEYIGRFLSLCSLYVDKIESFRKQVNKMVKNRQYEELFRETRSTSLKERELDELYNNFDDAFLHLFPTFIEDFNALLQPAERIELTEDGHMPVSLRIFALIRIGIEDSSKIAEFLHYSVNTIYNYRARVKNGVIADRDNFERTVKKLGAQNKNT